MTRQEMHNEFKLLLDKVDSSSAPIFLPNEIDRLLSISQEKFVSKRAFGNNPRRTGFEEDQKRRDDLRTLITSAVIPKFSSSSFTSNKPNGSFYRLPNDYRHSIHEEVELFHRDTNESVGRVSVTPITHDRYSKIIDDPFNKPHKTKVYRLDYGGEDTFADGEPRMHVELITSSEYKAEGYILRYLRQPKDIRDAGGSLGGEDCALPEHTHREIVRMAVVEALEGTESPRYQSSKIELNEIE
tara:strand:- start:626 stop:1351 length:726 start_codon:yes stop_codon:yes gene_type:complete